MMNKKIVKRFLRIDGDIKINLYLTIAITHVSYWTFLLIENKNNKKNELLHFQFVLTRFRIREIIKCEKRKVCIFEKRKPLVNKWQ